MSACTFKRLNAGVRITGVFLTHQTDPVAATIDDLILIWASSEAEEWADHVTFLPIR
jgi:hypothetical protein